MARITTCSVKGTDKTMVKVIMADAELAGAVSKITAFVKAQGGYVTEKILTEELVSAINQAQCSSMREKLGLVKEAAPKAGDKVASFSL